jgi:hypothetical protein
MNTTDQTNQQVHHQGATMTTEPITTGEVLSVTRAVHDVAQIMSVTLGSGDPAQLGEASAATAPPPTFSKRSARPPRPASCGVRLTGSTRRPCPQSRT